MSAKYVYMVALCVLVFQTGQRVEAAPSLAPTSAPTQPCDPGYYFSSIGHATTTCITCPAGYYCSGDGQSAQCADGEYSLGTASSCQSCPLGMRHADNRDTCIACPAGYSCATPSLNPIECSNGTYAMSGVTLTCSTCPAGFRCSNNDQVPQPCPSGSYSGEGTIQCTLCPAGHTCHEPSDLPTACPVGKYSFSGSTSCIECPRG
jgi:hypothetical protein